MSLVERAAPVGDSKDDSNYNVTGENGDSESGKTYAMSYDGSPTAFTDSDCI